MGHGRLSVCSFFMALVILLSLLPPCHAQPKPAVAEASQRDGSCEATILYGGPAFDPFFQCPDDLSIRMILGLTRERQWVGDGGNQLSLVL